MSYPAHPKTKKGRAKTQNRWPSCRENAGHYHCLYPPRPKRPFFHHIQSPPPPARVRSPRVKSGPSSASSENWVSPISFHHQAGGASLRAWPVPPELTCPWPQPSSTRTSQTPHQFNHPVLAVPLSGSKPFDPEARPTKAALEERGREREERAFPPSARATTSAYCRRSDLRRHEGCARP